MKKFISWLLLATMLAGIMSAFCLGATATGLKGSGSENDPYLIGSIEDWNAFAEIANTSEIGTEFNVKQTADLDFLNNTGLFKPIEYFTGVYDGHGYSIYGVNSTATQQVGLFLQFRNATLKNLNVDNSKFEVTAGTECAISALVAFARSKDAKTPADNVIENCHIGSGVTITSTAINARIGSIVGDAKMYTKKDRSTITILNCVSNATISASNCSNSNRAGGIIGIASATSAYGTATIENCVYEGTITVTKTDAENNKISAGGIAGELSAKANFIEGCFANAKIKTENNETTACYIGAIVGGILGQDNSTIEIKNCSAYSEKEIYSKTIYSNPGDINTDNNTVNLSDETAAVVREKHTDVEKSLIFPFFAYQRSNTENDAFNIRFVAGVSSILKTSSSKIGFEITRVDTEKTKNIESSAVYYSLNGYDKDTGKTISYSANEFDGVSYLAAITLNNVPTNGDYEFQIRPYFVDAESTNKTYGEFKTFIISNGEINNQ